MGKTTEVIDEAQSQSSSSPDLLLNGSKAQINSRAFSTTSFTPIPTSHRAHRLENERPMSNLEPITILNKKMNTNYVLKSEESNDKPRDSSDSQLNIYVPIIRTDIIEDKLDLMSSEYDDRVSMVSEELDKYDDDEILITDSFEVIKQSDGKDKEILQHQSHEDISLISCDTLNLGILEKEFSSDIKESEIRHPKDKTSYETMLEILNNVETTTRSESYQDSSYTPSTTSNGHNDKSSIKSKLENLMNYLDVVEMDNEGSDRDDKSVLNENNRMETEIYEILKRPPKKLAEEIIILNLKIEDHIRTEKSLEEELQIHKESLSSSSHQFQKELKHRLKMQKQEYDSAISRHQNFIDQLIEDKKTLRDQADSLLSEQNHLEKKYDDGIKGLESRHTAEIRRLKSLYESSSKLKQEKWLDEKTKRIKEQTVKGLEPELQRLVARHVQEIKKMESDKTQSLLLQEREIHQRHLQHVQELRSIWDHEQVELIQKEREILMNRHTQHLEEIRVVHREELDRLQEQLTRERDRNLDERGHFEREAEQIRRIAKQRAKDEIERIKEEEENKRRTLLKKHSNELSLLRENETEDRLEWERNCRGRLDEEWRLKEEHIRRTITSQKEEELREAIHQSENKVNQYKENAQNEIDERIMRLKERYEVEIKDLKEENEVIRDKHAKSRDDLRKKEEENLVLMAVCKQRELYAEEMQRINSKLESERENVRKSVRGEFLSTIETLTDDKNSILQEMGNLRIKVSELQSQIESDKVKMKIEKEEDAERIHSRVKSAISRKDEAITELKNKLDKCQTENANLEALLRRHAEVKYLKKR
ncbi:uncharacterized protein [Lepeophtheirus salmonis]|uniref:uncharacterized protein isoform X1 n=3 Tax=Lepeophtheirus salmonis TaxID=72036 RepID=UPI001AE50BB4|nr:centrosomal protein of 131 kDa-like isoform X1 [Lepeophtheirus salmonis]